MLFIRFSFTSVMQEPLKKLERSSTFYYNNNSSSKKKSYIGTNEGIANTTSSEENETKSQDAPTHPFDKDIEDISATKIRMATEAIEGKYGI